jgi:hypothetical protein
MRGFDSTGWLITVLTQNVADVGGFLIILLIILAGFSVIFKALLRTVEGACKLQLPSDDGSLDSVEEDCDDDPYGVYVYALTAFNVFNMGIMVRRYQCRYQCHVAYDYYYYYYHIANYRDLFIGRL